MADSKDTMVEARSEGLKPVETENNHTYDALAVVCSDGEYYKSNNAFYEFLGLDSLRVDELKRPAAARKLARPMDIANYTSVRLDIKTLLELHGKRANYPIFLIWHRKCGGYDFADTKEQILSDIQKAKEAVEDFKKPTRFFIAEITERNPDSIPQTIKYTEFTFNQSEISEKELFTYTNGRNSSSS